VPKLSGFWWTKLTSNTGWPACVKVSRSRYFLVGDSANTVGGVCRIVCCVCEEKNLMVTTNIDDDDDANLLMRKKLLMLCRTIVWNKIGVRPGRSVESVLVLGL
jgi:hypothetical protein